MSQTSIGKASGEGVIHQNSEKWNVADGFTKIKILRLIIELDLFETIAIFGKKDMEEEIEEKIIPFKRIEALQRMIFCLKQLIGNCKFSIEKGDKFSISNLLERIRSVEEVMKGSYSEVTNDITKETTLMINEDHFMNCFNILKDVKDELNVPINSAGLIFRKTEDVDLDSIMNSIMEGG